MKLIKLSRKSSHARALVKNLATSLVLYERLKTTPTKAKVAQAHTEHLITLSKRWLTANTVGQKLAIYRQLLAQTADELAVKKLTEVLAERFKDRAGGYTRRLRLGHRLGDAAEQVVVSLTELTKPVEAEKPSKKEPASTKKSTKSTASSQASAASEAKE